MSLDYDAIQARADAATEGPWKALGLELSTVILDGSNKVLANLGNPLSGYNWKAAEFIAHAREDVPALLRENARLRAALDAVKEVHSHVAGMCGGCSDVNGDYHVWPCPTVAAIRAALEPKEDQ